MNTIELNPKSFNSLVRDPKGAKVQRVWITEFHGPVIDLVKSKRSII